MRQQKRILIGTAGSSIPSAVRCAFPADGTALERYSAIFDAVEINSSFHRRHRSNTWVKWADQTPEDFRFAVKLPKTITHQSKLVGVGALIDEFAADVAGLGQKLGVVLVQLPPSLAFDAGLVAEFFDALSSAVSVPIACEPRHESWFADDADALLERRGIARVAADPALDDLAARPGGSAKLTYWRLHGSPQMYRSPYGPERVADYARRIEAAPGVEAWCMFDNTASSAATADALAMRGEFSRASTPSAEAIDHRAVRPPPSDR
jgi:uncharacterized protein YecE (DUF72 family)